MIQNPVPDRSWGGYSIDWVRGEQGKIPFGVPRQEKGVNVYFRMMTIRRNEFPTIYIYIYIYIYICIFIQMRDLTYVFLKNNLNERCNTNSS
jgi:hypothetical protein